MLQAFQCNSAVLSNILCSSDTKKRAFLLQWDWFSIFQWWLSASDRASYFTGLGCGHVWICTLTNVYNTQLCSVNAIHTTALHRAQGVRNQWTGFLNVQLITPPSRCCRQLWGSYASFRQVTQMNITGWSTRQAPVISWFFHSTRHRPCSFPEAGRIGGLGPEFNVVASVLAMPT